MKAPSTFRLVSLFAFSLISFAATAQGPQTIIQVPIATSRTEGAILYLPDDYTTSSTNYPIIVFLHGIGEGGTNPASIYNSSTAGGPAYFIAHGQWPSSTINPSDGLPYKFIVVSPQNNEGWSTTAPELDYVLSYMINNYRVDTTRLYLTGLSAGGEGITEYIAKRLGSGTYINTSHQIAAYVPMSAVVNGGLLNEIADTVVADNVRIWGFGSPSDTHGQNTLRTVKFVNDIVHGFGVSTSYSGGHCCWNQFYNPIFTQAINGQIMNIYQWMLMYKRMYTAPGNIPPTVSAGVTQTIVLPLNSAPLKGTASGNAGAKISSVVWTQVSGPNIAVLVSPNSLSTDANGLISGTYIFKLSATDDNGMTSSSTVTTRVDMNPTANAGSNIVLISPQNSTSLNGTASSDPDGSIADYSWTKISGPNQGKISNANTATPTLSNLSIGIYIYQLTVTDNNGAKSSAQVSITINPAVNQPPIADAGANQTITLPTNTVTLNGSASSDPDGTISTDSWTKVSGPASGTIVASGSVSTVVNGLTAGTYVFALTVTDNSGASSSDQVNITVNAVPNQPPVANAGANQTIILPINTVTLNGSASSDPDGTISTYNWTKVSGPASGTIATSGNVSTAVNGLTAGSYVFALTVTDNSGATSSDQVNITVNAVPNQPPVANAGANQTIILPINTVTLNGSASSDPDGTISTYNWTKISGPASGTIATSGNVSTAVNGLTAGSYVFALTVTDNSGATASAQVFVTVNPAPNQPPVANAGANQTIILPINTVTLNGSASSDPDGTISTYSWTKVSGPASGTIATSGNVSTAVNGLTVGSYVFALTVTDNSGATATAQVFVTVNPAPNQPPVANAGANQTIILPINTVTLNGSASSDPDGTISSYSWTKVSGPASGTIATSGNVSTAVNGLTAGSYVFALTVTDNNSATSTDQVNITVNAAPNQPPVANAGANQTIILPINTVTLNGSASSDPDGTISTYSWTKVSGPTSGTIATSGNVSTAVNGLTAGSYVFALTVTDNSGATSTDQVGIIVNPATNQPPVANAGANQTITLPTNTVTLNGSASSDPDGTISTYSWTKVSGPASGTIATSGNVSTAVNGLTVGSYVFALTVIDNSGATATAQVFVTVNPAPNQPPVANAGANQTIILPNNTVTLNGSASSDPDGTISTYSWTKVSGPASGTIATSGNVSTAVNGLTAGSYVFALTVTDNSGATSTDQVNITVNAAPNQPPVANAGANQTIILPINTVTLNGSASSDPDGTISNYSWTKVSGPASGTIATSGNVSTTVNGLTAGSYVFALTVTDNSGASSSDQVGITVSVASVNQSPNADAGANQTITLPTNTVTLNGSASSDPDGSISTYSWTKVSGPASGTIVASGSVSTAVNGLTAGTYVFALTVTDNSGASSSDQVNITVNAVPNQPPVANAGANQTIILPINTVTLNGSASSDPDGTISTYNWTKVSGPASGTIATSGSVSTAVNGLTAGAYVFELTVTDNGGATSTDQVNITVNIAPNQSPVANAGANQTIILPINTVTLNGSASSDPDGTISTYNWTKISGPASGTIATSGNVSTAVNGLNAGSYVFALTVTDNSGASSSDQVNITVNAAPNQPPVANAGANQTIILPINTVTLNGSASSDPDGTISTYSWTKVSGPSSGTIATSGNMSTAVNGLTAGSYVFALTVTDNSGATATAQVFVTVNPAPNQPPVANAGANQTITLPTNTVTLNGSASSDPDGTISAYSWTKVSGPASGTIATSGNVSTAINGLTIGTYVFILTVTDNSGATASAQVFVTVNPALNQPPVANAGANQTITLPINTVILNGSASSDPDGTISTYSWTRVSGPASGTIATSGNVSTAVNGLTAGTYVFALTVTDTSGATSTDQVGIIVNPATNQPPVANAGANQTIILPSNTITLNGSASSDPDGTISTYSWTKVSGPASGTIAASGNVSTAVNGLTAGSYVFALTVTDNSGATSSDQVSIIVSVASVNQSPVANAGANQTIILPTNTVTLNGSASSDPDGTISTYNWTKVSGPASGTIATPGNVSTAVNGLTAGTYVFALMVTDNNGAGSGDQVIITVTPAINQSPVANAGANQTITLPTNTITLNGSASSDPDGTISGYSWTKISGPANGTIATSGNMSTAVNGLTAGSYVFALTVTDNSGASSSDQVNIIVNAAPNQSPIANAGTNQTITLPTNTATLNGSASSDPDGSISTYNWTQVSGPTNASITSPSSVIVNISELVAGTYVFALSVTDNNGGESSAQVSIIVRSTANQPPVADAGTDMTLILPHNSTSIDGTASSDVDGNIVTYQWIQISGPTEANMAYINSAEVSVSNLQIGLYTFELTVTDNNGASSSTQVKITVIAASNIDPIANAGNNLSLSLPIVSLRLDGSRSFDPDGTINSQEWTQVSGPSAVSISNGNTAFPSLSGFIVGTYVFQLTVTDNEGATASDQDTIFVNPAITGSNTNQSPVANAGQDISVTLPSNIANLDGSASTDPDGKIVNYSWNQISGPSAASIGDASGIVTTVSNLAAGEYLFQLVVTDNNGAISEDTVKIDVTDAQAQLRYTSQVVIYPNPGHDIVHIKLTNDYTGKVSLMIFDATGIPVITKELNKSEAILDGTIDIIALKSGVYFVQVLYNNTMQPQNAVKRFVGKLVKQ